MIKSIKVEVTDLGQKYFTIYEVKAVKHNGETVVYEREMKKKAAEEDVELIERVHKKLYLFAYITEQIVWC